MTGLGKLELEFNRISPSPGLSRPVLNLEDSMDPESLAWMGSPPTQHDWAGWWPVLRRRAGTNPECDAGLHREQGENSSVDAERWETQAWKTCA